ncbi:MAG: ribosome maturation factor RimM [Candidatus Marinimicrobia bacterium]|nr:ribosome maturation factor RimM [Candidatus Neomarinimicrobiota bacterium]
MQLAEANRTAIGVVRKPHGVRGGLKVTLYSIDLDALQKLEQLFVNTGNNWQPLSLKSCQGYDDFAILSFNEISDRTQAENYRELELFTEREALPELDEDEFYLDDLVGCSVMDEQGRSLGKVVDILTPASHEVLVIHHGDKEILVPLVDKWVTDIDIKNSRIQINSVEVLS